MSPPDLSALPELPLDADGPVFAEPWQAQAFALAIQLHEEGAFTWPEWVEALSTHLKAAGEVDDGSRYFEHWLAALEDLANAKRLIDATALAARKKAWRAAYERTARGQPVEL